MQRHVIVALRVLCLVLLLVMAASAQQSPTLPALTQAANSDPAYRSLRSPGLGEVVPLRELVLQRDAGTFTLTGALTFLARVNGRVTGAVFFGKGRFDLAPPIEVERRALAQITKLPALHEEFDHAVFRFTDGTFEEVKKATPPDVEKTSGGDVRALLDGNQRLLRKDLKYNLDARLVVPLTGISEPPKRVLINYNADVLSTENGKW